MGIGCLCSTKVPSRSSIGTRVAAVDSMRHSFSAEFLKILPPATNFGEAWENLCLCLLQAETGDTKIMRLGPPDRGIDIYRKRARAAYQCKSSERGTFGTID